MSSPKNKKEQLRELMKLHYGFANFRSGQERAVDNVLAGKSSVIIMPTGGGKSLCYQLPALILDGVTIVISPLIALMKDQVDRLNKVGIPATFINSSITMSEAMDRLDAVKKGVFKLLYIAPERFYNQEFNDALNEIKVGLFAVDEAHCISQWGHDFRPSYIKLKTAIDLVGQPPVMALTATATPEVREDIIRQLGLVDPDKVVTGFARPNLQFGVIHASESQKPRHVLDVITSVGDETGIVYVGTRARADSLLQYLLENQVEAVSYHAGMEAEDRKWVQENFMSGEAKVIVATNAFGLGIDKANIRFVIHYDMPGTVEAYYQEAGRSGRDGKPSICLLLYNSRDRRLQEFFIKGDNPPPGVIREIYEILAGHDSDTVLITYAEIIEMLSETVPEMTVGTALKILEREGYIARTTEKSGQAYLKFISDFNRIYDSLGAQAKKQRAALVKLNDKFGDRVTQGASLNLADVAGVLDINKETLMRLIRALKEKNLVEYNPPFRGTEIRILKRVESRDLKFNETALKAKLRAAYAKLDRIEDYAFSLDCRQKFILDYFGDADAKECGKCDSCLVRGGYERKHQAPDKNHPGRKSEKTRSTLSTKLTQLETFDLYNKGLSPEEIAERRELSPATIASHIGYLIEKKLIKDIDKLVDKKTRDKVLKAAKKVGAGKLKPVYEELKEQVDYDKIRFTLAKYRADNS